jgi:hypothetical protein
MKLPFSDNKLLALPGSILDAPLGPSSGPPAAGEHCDSRGADAFQFPAGPAGAPMVHIPTPQLRHFANKIVKRQLTRSSRRFYNRSLLGMKLPGRYYFLTYTTAMTTKYFVGHYWRSLWKWHKRYRPGSCCCYGITREGKAKGVIHMIVRLGHNEQRMDVKELRSHWFKMTGAVQLKIKYVGHDRKKLAGYISDQRKKRGLAGEMAWQDYLDKWRWTEGWLPKGFTKAFPRVWARFMNAPMEVREKAIGDWLNACHLNNDKVKYPPWIIQTKNHGSEILTSNINNQAVENAI